MHLKKNHSISKERVLPFLDVCVPPTPVRLTMVLRVIVSIQLSVIRMSLACFHGCSDTRTHSLMLIYQCCC